MHSPVRTLKVVFLTALTLSLSFSDTIIHEFGHLMVLLLGGAEVSTFMIGHVDSNILFSFMYKGIEFILSENFHFMGGHVSYNPHSLNHPILLWMYLASMSGVFVALHYLVFILWGWVRFAGYKIGLLHFYGVVYKKMFKFLTFAFYPPLMFDAFSKFIKNPLPEGKRPSFWIFLKLKTSSLNIIAFCISFFWVLMNAQQQLYNWIPLVGVDGTTDGAVGFYIFISLFFDNLTVVEASQIGVGALAGWGIYFVIATFATLVKRSA